MRFTHFKASLREAGSVVVLVVAILFSATAAAIPIAGVESGVADRTTGAEVLLSELIIGIEANCEDSSRIELDEKFADKEVSEEKFIKQLNKKFFKCLKKSLKQLKKDDIITKDEEKALQKAVKAAKKAAKNGDNDGGDGVATVAGVIHSVAGGVLAGVEVEANSNADVAMAVSDESGAYQLALVADETYVVSFIGAGLANQIKLITAGADGSAQTLNVSMSARAGAQPASSGATVFGVDGSQVDLRNADGSHSQFVDLNNNPAMDVWVSITPSDISEIVGRATLPGERENFVFRSVVEFEFIDSAGHPLQLAAGQTALITLPLYIALDENRAALMVGQAMSSYSLNEASGIWELEADGTLVSAGGAPTGLALETRVGHFSFKAAIPGSGRPRIEGFVGFPVQGTFCLDLELLNSGGRASSYVLGPQDAGNISVVLLPGTSTIMLTMPSERPYHFWDSDLTASNGSGSSTRQLFLDNEAFDFDDPSDPLLRCP